MDLKLQSVIEKVRKLIALTSSSNAAEAATAAAIANKLIDQYRLSEADIDAPDMDAIIEDDQFIYETGRVTRWKQNLLAVLTKHYGTVGFNKISYENNRKVSRYKLIGRKTDIDITRHMFNWIVDECNRLSEKEAYGKGRVYVNSYCMGFVEGIYRQLQNSRKEVAEKASTTALVKINNRQSEANDFLNKKYKVKNANNQSQSKIDHSAYSAGINDGKNAHLGPVISKE